ncbi:MAG: hypothetical protein K9G44_06455 [Melioribacteraceae bacterium]|nr:hypothetical protein [Melioribacteraceae bacterium]
MCRLLYIKSKNEFEIPEYLNRFSKICKKSKEFQGHGWGISYIKNDEWIHYKNVSPIWDDNLTQFPESNQIIVHARSAFQDKDIRVENNMPFYDTNRVFIFNGELRGVKIKAEGRIGAEKIFNFINRFFKNDYLEALKKGTEVIIKRSGYVRAMNIIVSDKSNVFVSSTFNEDPEYFQMKFANQDDRLMICSEELEGIPDWKLIENNSVRKF